MLKRWQRKLTPFECHFINTQAEWRICASDNLAIIVSDNGLSPGRQQAIIWTDAGILLIGPLGTNFDEILIGIQTFGQLVVIPLLKWPFIQEYDTEYFQISYDKC